MKKKTSETQTQTEIEVKYGIKKWIGLELDAFGKKIHTHAHQLCNEKQQVSWSYSGFMPKHDSFQAFPFVT